jgi:hypothetical protein
MTQLGIDVLAGHMFILYFAVMSALTPPVAVAAYAAVLPSLRLAFVAIAVYAAFVAHWYLRGRHAFSSQPAPSPPASSSRPASGAGESRS